MHPVLILDSTLREGEQAPNVRFSHEQAVKIASELDSFGVDFIEVSPIVSERSMQITKSIIEMGLKSNPILHGRATKGDIDKLLSFSPNWVALYLSTSDVHLEHKLHMSREIAKQRAVETIEYAKSHGLKLRFTCEDASRTDAAYLAEMVKVATDAGADRISITDTVGALTPSLMFSLVQGVHTAVPKANLDVHCHNDLGLALANSLAGVEAGATCIHTCINGAGERAGIPKLAEVALALQVLYEQRGELKIEKLPELSKMFSSFTGLHSDVFSPVVGENVFRHKGGTHLGAVLRSEGKAYEAFSPESVGRKRRLVIGEYSGKNVLRYLSGELHLGLTEEQIERTISRLKEKEGDIFEFEL
ncbi:putative homocitrate synthase AksA [Candidatus Anstonella stagnisolia]|nr:putative homocitrate synthase AksA [Candidatus Anstonella stagnisolia]